MIRDRKPEPPPAGMRRVRMTVAYDGTPFHGFARNEGVPTVAGALEDTLGQILRHPVELACAGRTDKGVHAQGQVVSFDADEQRIDPSRLVRAVNRMCAPAIATRDAALVADDFDARLSCTARVYLYRIRNAEIPDPLEARWSWHVEQALDLEAMEAATESLIGSHDFSSFCRRNRSRPDESLVRRVTSAGWRHEAQKLSFEIEANAFCHQMVRSLVGTLVEIGRGRRRASDMATILVAQDRAQAVGPAPPHGLILVEARYPEPAPNPR